MKKTESVSKDRRPKKEKTPFYVRCPDCNSFSQECDTCDRTGYIKSEYSLEDIERYNEELERAWQKAIDNGYDPQCE